MLMTAPSPSSGSGIRWLVREIDEPGRGQPSNIKKEESVCGRDSVRRIRNGEDQVAIVQHPIPKPTDTSDN